MRGLRFCFLMCSFFTFAQEETLSPAEFESLVGGANGVFKLAWPFLIQRLEGEMTKSFSEMNDGMAVRKLKVTELKLDQPPTLEVLDWNGKPGMKRVRLSLPGKGKWAIKVAGEIIPPWQKNQDKWRKLRLTLKDVSLVQEFEVDLSKSTLAFTPLGPPELTYKLTSPNLLYKAVLATAQKFMKSSLETLLEEEFMTGLPIAEIALSDLKGFNLNSAISQLGDSLEPELGEYPVGHPLSEKVAFLPLDGPPPEDSFNQQFDDDAFSVGFIEKDLDFFAPSFTAEVEIKIPPGHDVAEVVFKLGDRDIATLTQPPWKIEVEPGDDAQVLLATATLKDGVQEDDFLYIEGRGHIEEMEVQYTNLYINFLEKEFKDDELRNIRPEHFEVKENDIPQDIVNIQIARDRPIALSVVMDNSGSMEGDRIKQARKAAGQFIERIYKPGDAMLLVAYNDKVRPSKITYDKGQMLNAIQGLKDMRGSTRTYDGVAMALDKTRDLDANRVILLITDGFNYGSKIKFEALQRRLEQDNALLYAIGLDVRRNRKIAKVASLKGPSRMLSAQRPSMVHLARLYDMAAITGGRTLFVDKPKWLYEAFGIIEKELRSQIQLGYYSNLPGRKKGWRRIHVTYLPESTPIHHKQGYWKE